MADPSVPVSMEDVARLAGVSTATVSRTLRGLPNVSEETRGRVLQAAESLSYVVSPIASRLASGRTHTVGVIVPYASRWFFGQIVAGAESVLREHSLDLLLYNLGDIPARQRFFGQLPLRRRVDAVLTVAMQFTDAELSAMRSLGVPIVAVGHHVPGAGCVRIDDVAAAATAIQHLLGLGHKRVGMISTYNDQSMFLPVAHARRRAYVETLAAAGVPFHSELVMSVPHGMDGGEQAMRRLLTLADPPTAVFAESDELAFGALSALRRTGRHVSVIGFDDHELSALLDLTTVRQRVFEQGVLAAGMLRRAMTTSDWTPEELLMPTTLVLRASTWPVAVRTPDAG
ncbi:LacI family DNA-binding transcriptional regulator [Dactylosporangium sp. AC04546]|uniref:LacI family DNA-binding transcriptional regulator n=1 Tax=Dactylosporangium sp. AC04546 TaxID=2862460 RepID=UPI001EE063C8|nr:LacI family DNA-binding transcriptional regulator [Dactylosporangium sp. AC04546]WVK82704.1 LacI family DNA-binding transcriptional regulator [Dactylosporangium sp. AC04546]